MTAGVWVSNDEPANTCRPSESLTVRAFAVDGSSFDTTVKGPAPNLKKAPPPAPGPGLWQVYGVARGSAFSLTAMASVQGRERRSSKLTVSAHGGTLTVTESGGCGRTAHTPLV